MAFHLTSPKNAALTYLTQQEPGWSTAEISWRQQRHHPGSTWPQNCWESGAWVVEVCFRQPTCSVSGWSFFVSFVTLIWKSPRCSGSTTDWGRHQQTNLLLYSGAFSVRGCICFWHFHLALLEVNDLRRSSLPDIAAGTTKGNLASTTRLTYLPLLIDFLQVIIFWSFTTNTIKAFFSDSAHLTALIATWVTIVCRGCKSKSRPLFSTDLQCWQLLQAENQIAPAPDPEEIRGAGTIACRTEMIWVSLTLSGFHALSQYFLYLYLPMPP